MRSLPTFGRMGGRFGMMGRAPVPVSTLPPLPLSPLFTVIGDGVMSEGAAGGSRNTITRALIEMSGRVIPSEMHNMCRSGDSAALMTTRMPYATGQVGTANHIAVLTSFGHNDAIMTTDPAGAPGIALMNAWKALVDLFLSGIPAGNHIRIVLSTTIGSTASGESTYSAAVNVIQKAYLTGKAASDPRITVWDAYPLYNYSNAANLSPSSDSSKVHPDDRGARQLAFGNGTNPGLYDVVSALVVPATRAEVLTYIATLGTNFDSNTLLSGGTTGTLNGSGVTPTGQWPTGKILTNNLANGSSMAVAASIVDQTTYKQAKAVISGVPAATQTVLIDTTSNVSATGSTPGRYFSPMVAIKLDDGAGGSPLGLMAYSLVWGTFGTLGSASDASASLNTGVGRAVDAFHVGQPFATYGSAGPMATKPLITFRGFASTLDIEITVDHLNLIELYTVARAQPCPIWKASTIFAANYVQRLTGTFSNGSTIRAETGHWSGGGFSDTAFATRKIYQTDTNSGADAVEGAGTLMTTLSGSTWSWVASGLTAGKFLWLDITLNNGIGSPVTARAGPYTVV